MSADVVPWAPALACNPSPPTPNLRGAAPSREGSNTEMGGMRHPVTKVSSMLATKLQRFELRASGEIDEETDEDEKLAGAADEE